MTNSEKNRIRKRIDPTLSNFKNIYGCYVNAAGEIVSTMVIPVAEMKQEEREQYSALFRKVISGVLGKSLLDLSFTTKQVEDSDEHRLLMALRDTHLEDEGMRESFYQEVVDNFELPGKGYVILLAGEVFDIAGEDDDEWSDDSESQFEYYICSICGVKEPKAVLRYMREPKAFHGASTGSLLASPIAGFMFPAFEDNQANIYEFLYFSKGQDDLHKELLEGFFKLDDMPLPANMQKAVFNETLSEALGEECSMDVITGVQAKISARIGDNEGENAAVMPEISLDEVGSILASKGVSEDRIEEFKSLAEDRLGDKVLQASNLLQKSSYRITSSDSDITVDPEQALRIKTRKIDGVTYFLVPVGSDVRVNGVDISMSGIWEEDER